jgi:hypothetical protein
MNVIHSKSKETEFVLGYKERTVNLKIDSLSLSLSLSLGGGGGVVMHLKWNMTPGTFRATCVCHVVTKYFSIQLHHHHHQWR